MHDSNLKLAYAVYITRLPTFHANTLNRPLEFPAAEFEANSFITNYVPTTSPSRAVV